MNSWVTIQTVLKRLLSVPRLSDARRRRTLSFQLFILLSSSLVLANACKSHLDIVAFQNEGENLGGVSSGAGGTSTRDPDLPLGGRSQEESLRGLLPLEGDLGAHDVSLAVGGQTHVLFHTGAGIPRKVSSDLLEWTSASSVFEELPSWITETLPNVTSLWAPDVAYFGGTYHLYYAASTFGSGVSCIGHATTDAVDGSETWLDRGPVICSNVETEDDWDAIDPHSFADALGDRWLVFGSFGSGIKLIALDAQGERRDDTIYDLAARPVERAIQAPSLLYRAPYYYLFVSFDRCCQGVSSTSNLRVGRASDVTGPYMAKDGASLLDGGGSVYLEGNERFVAAGGIALFEFEGRIFNAFHAYDANAAGRATLRISEVTWDDEAWPQTSGP